MNGGTDASSFFQALFDFSFKSFVTTKIIKVLYILAIIGVTIWSLVILVGGVTQGGMGAVLGVVGGVLGFFLGIVYARVLLEFIIVVFRIAENTAIIARAAGGASGAPGITGGGPLDGGTSGGSAPPPPPGWGSTPGGPGTPPPSGPSGPPPGGPLGPPPAGPIGGS